MQNGHARSRILFLFTALFFAWPISACGTSVLAATNPISIAVLPFEIDDNSGETDPPERHDTMLSAVTATIRHSIAATNMYTVVRGTKIDEAVNQP
jgi:hypothetical protein